MPAVASPLSAYEYHEGTFKTSNGRVSLATLKLVIRAHARPVDLSRYGSSSQPQASTLPSSHTGLSVPSEDRHYATLVIQTPQGAVRPDSVVEFAFDRRRFVYLGQLTRDGSLRDEINTDFVEVFQDTGRIELYGYYPTRSNRFVLTSLTPGMIHEDDLVRSFIWRRRGTPGFEILAHVPPRGFNEQFERQLRSLFADRADILKYLNSHDLHREDLPAAVRAYNSGLPFRFE